MEQVRALTAVIHKGQIHKAGHIFKIPDDMGLETAKRLVDKEIVTAAIEVLEEAEVVEVIDPADVLAEAESTETTEDEGSGEPGEEVTELDGEATEDDQGSEGEAPEDTTGEQTGSEGDAGGNEDDNGEEAVDIATFTKKELKAELKHREIEFTNRDSKDVLYDKLKSALDAENATSDEQSNAGEGEED